MKLNEVVIGVGSNIDPENNIKEAKKAVELTHNLIRTSSFIETEPIGCKNQNNFLNGAFLIKTEMDTLTLKSWLKSLEKKLGRIRSENKNGPRTIDLDIIIWNKEVVDNEVYEREFLLNSINELLPELKINTK
ncbi:MAG: 2-amino-4-hydroxy-6-hydroxymethyldihydropteridine diphosphokinase [Thermodesulfobacteriota bacterium]|nr:MAG: 2-amino-4-hydroxy-6-hydroxymethyldihydropteridine diphosphokinase [Thermodesulfobacteriota bacterium]